MDKGQARAVVLVLAVMAAVVWLVSMGGAARVKAQASVAADAGDDGTLTVKGQLSTGICPDKWQPHMPRNAHMGAHRMYRHPARCSPNLTAPHKVAYDWLWCPPSEGDL